MKTIRNLLPALLIVARWAAPGPVVAQTPLCVELKCPTAPITVPCDGPFGSQNWLSVVTNVITAFNPCNPSNPPPILQITPPPGTPLPLGSMQTVCVVYGWAGTAVTKECCVPVIVSGCCGTNCLRIVCPNDVMVPCDPALGGAMVDLSLPQFKPRIVNDCGGPIPTWITVTTLPSPPAGGGPVFFEPGPHTIVACLVDQLTGREDCCCFQIFVGGPTCPPPPATQCPIRVICPTNLVVCTTNGAGTTNVPFQGPIVTNLCGRPVVVVNTTSSVPPGYLFPLGKTTVATCVRWFDDFTGKSGTNCCCYDVVVQCCTNPPPCTSVLVCPGDQVVDCPGPNGLPLNYPVFGTNPCYQTVLICTPPPGTIIFGTTNVCCSLVDAATGLVLTQCCFKVTAFCPSNCVPILQCPTNNLYYLCAGPNGLPVRYPPITVTDPCDPYPHVVASPPTGSWFPPGCWPVTVTAWDYLGNSNTCTFKVCVLRSGCYLKNPSFEQIVAKPQTPNFCGEPVDDAQFWTTLSGTPKLFRPPVAVVTNCWGWEAPCQGTNYAGISGGYNAGGGFQTDEILGRLMVPLSNGRQFRLRACLSLAEGSPGPAVLVEFVLANQASPLQQQVIHQTWVQLRTGWQPVRPPCFTVPQTGVWDALIIRAAKVSPAAGNPYPVGQVYVDNVNICCCNRLVWVNPGTLSWDTGGSLQFAPGLGGSNTWQDLGSQFTPDPMTGMRTLQVLPSLMMSGPMGFFQVLDADPEDTPDCNCYP